MTTILRIAAIGLIAMIGYGSSTAGTADLTVTGATTAEHELVQWAQERYAAAGLELPELTIRFHDGPAGCGGYNGYYTQDTGTVDICNRGGGTTDPGLTVLHELAHAWTFEHLTGSEAATWSQGRGLDTWTGADAWWQQGQEQAAEILAWGLADRPFISQFLQSETCTDLATAYTALAGAAPRTTSTASCRG